MLTKVTKILQNVRRTLVYSNELLFLDGQVGLNPAVKSAAQALDIGVAQQAQGRHSDGAALTHSTVSHDGRILAGRELVKALRQIADRDVDRALDGACLQNIQALGREIGVELFERRGRSVLLTEAGQALLPMAQEVVGAITRMGEVMNGLDGKIAGELIVGCSTTSGKYLLPNLVAAFRHEYPLVRVSIKILARDEVIGRLIDERLALGVASHRVEHRDLEYAPFFEDRVILIVPANHGWANFGCALPADLVDEPMIMREERAGTTQVLSDGLAQHGITIDMLEPIMEIGNAEAIEMAVEEGIGIAFVSELAAARGLALGRVKKVEVEGLDLHRTIYLARNVRHPLTRAQERFWTFVVDQRDVFTDEIRRLADSLRASPDR